MRFIDIQNAVIERYGVTMSNGSDCPCGWCRTHAHIKERKVCKWKQKNSAKATFELLHEIGHVENNTLKMRRVEREYFATIWAIERCKEYGVEIPAKTIDDYQAYIDMELDRGKRRGGKGYADSYDIRSAI